MGGRVALQVQTALNGGVVECVGVGVCRLAFGTGGEGEQRALRHALGYECGDEYAALRERTVAVECNRVDVQQFGQCARAAARYPAALQTTLDAQCNETA